MTAINPPSAIAPPNIDNATRTATTSHFQPPRTATSLRATADTIPRTIAFVLPIITSGRPSWDASIVPIAGARRPGSPRPRSLTPPGRRPAES